jgi:hypothetical protein
MRAGRAFDALVEQLVHAGGGDVWLAQAQLQQAAWRQKDPAVQYLLLEEAVKVGERAGKAPVAMAGIWQLGAMFEIDTDEYSLALLRRMAVGPQENSAATASIAAWSAAYWRVGSVEPAALLRYHDVAMRAAAQCGRGELFGYLSERLNWLRAWQRFQANLLAKFDGVELEQRVNTMGNLARGERALRRVPAAWLTPFLREVPIDLGELTVGELSAEALTKLRKQAADPAVAEALLRAAKDALTRDWETLSTAAIAERAVLAAKWTARLASARGVQAQRFVRAEDREQLVYKHGNWHVEDGLLHGKAIGESNSATCRYAFRNTRSVVIRGGILGDANRNFRCKAGDVNLLLNWEVADENHFWRNGTRYAKGPRALVSGKEHTIVFLQDEDRVHVLIDGVELWNEPGCLDGTVTVYPALGSEIFVREILIDGDVDAFVDGPWGTLM